MRIAFRLLTAAALLLPLVLVSAEDKAYKPSLPLLHVKLVDGKTRVVKPGSDDALDEKAQKALLEQHAAHVDEGNGWKGQGPDGISENPLVLHVDAMADQREVCKVVANAAEKMIYRVVVGIPEHTDKPLKGSKAPDLEKPEAGYLHFDLPKKDEGLQSEPPTPKITLTLQVLWYSEEQGGSFVVAIDARGRKPVEKSRITADELKSKDAARRDEVCDAAKKQVQEHIARSGAKIVRLQLVAPTAREEEYSAPWAMVDLAYRAARAVNDERAKNKEAAIEICLPHLQREVPPPPLPVPPEKPVEFPKDEPKQEDPTEEPREVEPPKDTPKKEGGDAEDNGEQAESPNTPTDGYSHRLKPGKRANEDRVLAALNWLKDHQNKDGHWSADNFAADSSRAGATKTGNIEFITGENADKGWKETADVGLTGLALLAFTGHGFTHKAGDYRQVLRMGLVYLRKVQDNDGCFGAKEDDHFVYNHAIATMALAEVCGISGDGMLKPIVEKAVEFILKAQNPGLGWRYGVQPGLNDSSVTSWMVMALHAAGLAGIETDTSKSCADAAAWFKQVTVDVGGYPKCGYDSPGSNNARLRSAQEYDHNPTMDAIYLKCMLTMGQATTKDKTVKTLAKVCVEADYLPKWDHYKIDFYYWYYGSFALHAMGGKDWKTWEKAVSKTLTENQRGFSKLDKDAKRTSATDLDEHGSWDPVGAWGKAGGRVYSTAMAALTLETEWRSK
ncbi:MAG: hypothetical protein H6840_09160 [Planctomycetes bacterium]|nr:hypothetical protein [Planctomycetota bacterium]